MEALAHLGALVRNQQVLFLKSNTNLYLFTFRRVKSISHLSFLMTIVFATPILTAKHLAELIVLCTVKGNHISTSFGLQAKPVKADLRSLNPEL